MADPTPPPVIPGPPPPQPSPTGVTPAASPADPGNPYNLNSGTPAAPGATDPNTVTITVGGRQYPVQIVRTLSGTTQVTPKTLLQDRTGRRGGFEEVPSGTVADKLAEIQSWYGNATKRAQIVQQLYAAGLVNSKKAPSAAEIINAWALVVQEAATQNRSSKTPITPEDLLAKAAKSGWNSVGASLQPSDTGALGTGNLNNAADASTTTSSTVYKSYLDPATIMGAQADAWFRLMGRNPTQQEYQSFLGSVFQYQDASNTGKFESQTKDPSDKSFGAATGNAAGMDSAQTDPTTATTSISQRGIGQRGLQFLAGQSALANPQEGAYQAATTYFNAFIKALSGPASGMQASGPTNTVP